MESNNAFSITDDNLGKSIREYFQNDLALFEYSIFYPQENQPKGIILDYYGGYDGLQNSPTTNLSEVNRFF